MSISADRASVPPARGAAGDRLAGLGLLLVTASAWGLNWPVAKFLLGELPPFSMRALCSVGGVSFAFLLVRLRGERMAVAPSLWPRLVLYATLNYGAFTVFTTLSLVWLSASQAVVVTYTLPIWASLLAWPVLGERPTARSALAVVLGLAGVALLVGLDASAAGALQDTTRLPGVAAALTAAALFGLGTVLAKRRPLGLPLVTGVAWQIVLGMVPVFLLALTEHPVLAGVTPLGWAAVAYIATMPMTLAYMTWFRALHLLPAATAATGVLLAPLIGVAASAALLGDPLGPRQLAALAITLTGVGLAAWQPRAK